MISRSSRSLPAASSGALPFAIRIDSACAAALVARHTGAGHHDNVRPRLCRGPQPWARSRRLRCGRSIRSGADSASGRVLRYARPASASVAKSAVVAFRKIAGRFTDAAIIGPQHRDSVASQIIGENQERLMPEQASSRSCGPEPVIRTTAGNGPFPGGIVSVAASLTSAGSFS